MKSWREKLGGWGKQLKETASSKLSEAREAAKVTAEKALNAITSISGEVHSKVQAAVGEIIEPTANATAATPDGQMLTVAVDQQSAYYPNSTKGITGRNVTHQKENDLLDQIPMTSLMGEAASEVKEVFSTIRSGISETVSAMKSRIVPDIKDFSSRVLKLNQEKYDDWDEVFADFPAEEAVVPTASASVKPVNPYSPSLLNVHMEGLNGTDPAQKRRRTPPKGKLHTSADTIKAQAEQIKKKVAEREAKKNGSGSGGGNGNKGPEKKNSRNKKWALLAGALTTIGGYLAIDRVSDYMNDSTSTAPTASAKAPEKKVQPPIEQPVPVVTNETVNVPEPVETVPVETTPEKTPETTEPTPVTRKYAKTTLPKDDELVYPNEEKKYELPSKDVVKSNVPSDALRYNDAMKISRAVSIADGQIQKQIEYLENTGLHSQRIASSTRPDMNGSSAILFQPSDSAKIRELRMRAETLHNEIRTKNTHVPCNPGSSESGLSSRYLNVVRCDDDHMYTAETSKDLLERQTQLSRDIQNVATNRYTDLMNAQQTVHHRKYSEAKSNVLKIRDPKLRAGLLQQLETLNATAALVQSKSLPADFTSANDAIRRNIRTMDTIIKKTARIGNVAQGESDLDRIADGWTTPGSRKSRTASAIVDQRPIHERSTQHLTESDKELMNWTPESI